MPPLDGLPDNLRGLLELALAVPEEGDAKHSDHAPSFLGRVGSLSLAVWASIQALLDFTGQTVLSLLRFFTGRARFRASDFWMTLQQCGVEALPIVALISFLIGLPKRIWQWGV